MESEDLICVCMKIRRSTIVKSIAALNLTTVEEVGNATGAGTDCGSCHDAIMDELVVPGQS